MTSNLPEHFDVNQEFKIFRSFTTDGRSGWFLETSSASRFATKSWRKFEYDTSRDKLNTLQGFCYLSPSKSKIERIESVELLLGSFFNQFSS